MSATGDGIADYLTSAGTLTAPSPSYSYAFWYYPLHLPATGGAVTELFSMTSATTYEVDFIWDHTNGIYYRAAIHSSVGPLTILHMPTDPPINQWIHLAVTFDGSTISMYLNGKLWTSDASSAVPPAAQTANVWILAFKGPLYYLDGSIANVGVWSSCLTAANVLSLFTGTDPTTVAAGTQIFYDPLNTGVATVVGPALTNNGTTLNTTYFQGGQGGIEAGGDQIITNAIYHGLFTGGIKAGGSAFTSGAIYHVTMDGGIKAGGNATLSPGSYHFIMSGGIKAGGSSFTARAIYHVGMTGGLALGGAFQVSTLTPGGAFVMADGRSFAFTGK